MDEHIVTLRIIHLVSGILWVGAAMFIFFFLEAAVSKSGPAGGQGIVLQRLHLSA